MIETVIHIQYCLGLQMSREIFHFLNQGREANNGEKREMTLQTYNKVKTGIHNSCLKSESLGDQGSGFANLRVPWINSEALTQNKETN